MVYVRDQHGNVGWIRYSGKIKAIDADQQDPKEVVIESLLARRPATTCRSSTTRTGPTASASASSS